MYLVFVSNYFNHHQKALCDELNNALDGDFAFVETSSMEDEREKLGWGEIVEDYVIKLRDDPRKVKEIINGANVVIMGQAPIRLVKSRVNTGKLTLAYHERLFKKNDNLTYILPKIIKFRFMYARSKNVYLLCAGGFTYSDFIKMNLFRDKAFVWGYFPVYDDCNIERVISEKKKGSFVWVGRFIDWKHPEIALEIAKKVKQDNLDVTIKMIGEGELKSEIQKQIIELGLEKIISLGGPLRPEDVRKEMRKSEAILCTSDRNEGWGAVINEAMSCGCVPLACKDMGASKTLIKECENGYLFENGDISHLYKLVKKVAKDDNYIIQKNAYETVIKSWTAHVAATRVLITIKELEDGRIYWFDEGICSKP